MESFAEIRRTMFGGRTSETEKARDVEDCIMIIDDNEDILETLTSLLRSRYGIITCLSYEEASKRMSREVKVVLLDIKMASKDGVEAFRLLKEGREDLPIVFHSAYPGSSEKAAEVEGLDHSGYLTKGEYSTPELLEMIEQLLHQPVEASSTTSQIELSGQNSRRDN